MKRGTVLGLHVGQPTPGFDQYCPVIPNDWRKRAVRWWSFGGVVRSAQMPSGGAGGHRGELVKSFAGWGGAGTAEEIWAHAQEARELTGARCPSGYAGAVRAAIPPSLFPIESRTHTAPYLPLVRGAWQEALKVGTLRGAWRQYDLRSAYYSALLEGLPDPESYRCTRQLGTAGLYRVRIAAPVSGAPYPYSAETEVLATLEEISEYSLPVVEVIAGVRWTHHFKTQPIADACDMFSYKSRTRRCFWGTWASSQSVTCHARTGKSWTPLPPRPHPVWAHLIMSRVRMKVWRASARAAHVYVDSVITQDTLQTGDSPGTWQLVKEYPQGVVIGGTGRYANVGTLTWDKMAGVPVGDERRTIAA